MSESRCVVTAELRAEAERYYRDREYRESLPWAEAPVFQVGDYAEIIGTNEMHRVYGVFVGPVSGQWLYCIDGQHLYADELRPVPQSLRVQP